MKRYLATLLISALVAFGYPVHAITYVDSFKPVVETNLNEFTNDDTETAEGGVSFFSVSKSGLVLYFVSPDRDDGSCYYTGNNVCDCDNTSSDSTRIYRATRVDTGSSTPWVFDASYEIDLAGTETRGISLAKWKNDMEFVTSENLTGTDKLYLTVFSGGTHTTTEGPFSSINTYFSTECTTAEVYYPYLNYTGQVLTYYFTCEGGDTYGNAYSTCSSWDNVNDRCDSYSDPVIFVGTNNGTAVTHDMDVYASGSYLENMDQELKVGKFVSGNDTFDILYVMGHLGISGDNLLTKITNSTTSVVNLSTNEYSVINGNINGVVDYESRIMYRDDVRHCIGNSDFWIDPVTSDEYIFATVNRKLWYGSLVTTSTSQECYGGDVDCEDGYFCNGYEQCYSTLTYDGVTEEETFFCQNGIGTTPCGDNGIYCDGTDSCDEVSDSCTHELDVCSTSYCDGEQCCYEPDEMCIQGTDAITCDDSNVCTTDECSNDLEECVYTCNASSSEDPCCLNPACSDEPICTGELLNPCTYDDLVYYENFDDSDIDTPETGTIGTFKLMGVPSVENTDYVLNTDGYGGYGYAFDPDTGNDSHIIWDHADEVWDTDILHVSFVFRVAGLTGTTNQDIGLAAVKFNDGKDGVRLAIYNNSRISYTTYTSGMEHETRTISCSGMNNGEWHKLDLFLNVATSRSILRIWFDETMKTNNSYSAGFWNMDTVSSIEFFGRDGDIPNTYDRILDNVAVWKAMPPDFPCANNSQCTDAVYCNGTETCTAGVCVAGTNPCSDSVDCTDDTCDEVTRTCANTENNNNCDDLNACTLDVCSDDTDCSNTCIALYPNDECCSDSECSSKSVCTSTASVYLYENFDDEVVNSSIDVVSNKKTLSPGTEYTFDTGYGGTGYCLDSGTYASPYLRVVYDIEDGDTTVWSSNNLYVSYRMKFPTLTESYSMYVDLIVVKWHTETSMGTASVFYHPGMGSKPATVSYVFRSVKNTVMGTGVLNVEDYDIHDGEWHSFEFDFDFKLNSTSKARVWIDGDLLVNGTYNPNDWNKDIYYILAPGTDDESGNNTYTRSVDNLEIWTGIPGVLFTTCDEDSDCDESNECTNDYCIRGKCFSENNTDSCDDSDSCTVNDVCSGGTCGGDILDNDSDGDTTTDCGGTDCDDDDSTRYGTATEICDGIDNDCDDILPENELDVDVDGYMVCEDDCDDNDSDSSPGIVEGPYGDSSCSDGKDNDCDGYEDSLDSGCFQCDANEDCDDSNVCTLDTCSSGYCSYYNNTIECDDGDACTMDDACSGGVCAGVVLDADDDGFPPIVCSGMDCDDGNASMNPGEVEGPFGDATCSDTYDNDCDGTTDAVDTGCQAGTITRRILVIGG